MSDVRTALLLLFAAATLSVPSWAGADAGCLSLGDWLRAEEEPGCCVLAGTDRVTPQGEDCCGVVSAKGDQAPVQPSAVLAQVPAPLLAAPLALPLVAEGERPQPAPVTYAARAPPPHLAHHRSTVLLR